MGYRLRLAIRQLFTNFDKLIVSIIKNLLLNAVNYLISAVKHVKAIRFCSKGRLPYLSGIHLYAINSLFWVSIVDEMSKCGLRGVSKTLSDGHFELTNLWYSNPASFFAFRFMGIGLSVLCITLVPVAFLFFQQQNSWIVIGAMALFFSAPVVFSLAYTVGRYHSMAWLVFPWFVLGLVNEQFVLMAIALVLVALASSTVLALAFALAGPVVLVNFQLSFIYALVPGFFVGVGYPIYLMSGESLKEGGGRVFRILKGIGSTGGHQVKYKRTEQTNLGATFWWYVFGAAFYVIVAVYTFTSVPYLFITATIIFVINVLFARFADWQTVHFLMVLVGLSELLLYASSPLALLAPVFFTSFASIHRCGASNVYGSVPILSPQDVNSDVDSLSALISKIPQGNKLFIAFKDPNGVYEQLFNGYRHSIEGVQCAGVRQGVCALPNFHAVYQHNHPDDAGFWVNDLSELDSVARHWGCDYALINRKEYDCEDLPAADMLGAFSYDTSGFNSWSKKYFKNPDWILVKI